MKTVLMFLLTSCCYAQMPDPDALIKADAEPLEEVIVEPVPPGRMPIVRPSTSFYRLKTDPKNVVRATTDNMPVKMPDSSITYTMMQAPRSQYRYKMRPFARPVLPEPRKSTPQKQH